MMLAVATDAAGGGATDDAVVRLVQQPLQLVSPAHLLSLICSSQGTAVGRAVFEWSGIGSAIFVTVHPSQNRG